MTNEEITKYIFLDSADMKGDIAFVFGTRAWKEPVEKAVELYQKKLVSKIIFSGGVNKQSQVVEARIMAEEATKLGVPSADILIEDKSTNTLENVLFSLKIINKEVGLQNIKIITGVVKNYHARRALMTLRKHIPPHIQLRVATYISYYQFTKDNWTESTLGKEMVFRELEKIRLYLAKGDLAEL